MLHFLKDKKIAFFIRVNRYAHILLFMCIMNFTMAFAVRQMPFVIIFIVISITALYKSILIYSDFPHKIREYKILRNRVHLCYRDDLFKMYMDSPCGRLLVKEVLKDFGIEDRYTSLLKYKNNRFACKPNQKDAYFYFCEDAYEKLISGKLKKE